MPTITIRNIPDEVLKRLKEAAKRNGRSMEQELRLLIAERYVARSDILQRIRERKNKIVPPSADEVNHWIKSERDRREKANGI